MSPRAAQAAAQSDPDCNTQFRRWRPDGATGPDAAPLRAWHAGDAPILSTTRAAAERAWSQLAQASAAQ
jgi:hypothetical protein